MLCFRSVSALFITTLSMMSMMRLGVASRSYMNSILKSFRYSLLIKLFFWRFLAHHEYNQIATEEPEGVFTKENHTVEYYVPVFRAAYNLTETKGGRKNTQLVRFHRGVTRCVTRKGNYMLSHVACGGLVLLVAINEQPGMYVVKRSGFSESHIMRAFS